MKFLKTHWREVLVSTLIFLNLAVWVAVYGGHQDDTLSVYFIDVGQGDAIFIDSPGHKRVLIDGGKNRNVLSELGRLMLFGNRNIDVVIGTHPDADHIGGLPEVINRYNVGMFIEPGVSSESSIDSELERRIEQKGIPKLIAENGMVLNFGDGVKLQILFPNQDVSNWETNAASIVAKLIYGTQSFLLMGDSPIRIENILLNLNPQILDSDVLKVGHHGSRTSTSPLFAQAVSPEYAVISAGKDNTYGHPHQEVINVLNKVSAKIISTQDSGTIEFETNGQTLKVD